MQPIIVLADGRAWSAEPWAYDALLDAVAEELPREPAAQAFGTWLLDRRCNVRGSDDRTRLGLDLRELTSGNQALFVAAARAALITGRHRGPVDWWDPTRFRPWLEQLRRLLRMVSRVEHGRPPSELNDLFDVLPPTGRQDGPGWDPPTPPRGVRIIPPALLRRGRIR